MDGTGLLLQPFVEAMGQTTGCDIQTIAYAAREPLGDAPHALLQACPVASAEVVSAFVHEVCA
jgi:hypothetical protein